LLEGRGRPADGIPPEIAEFFRSEHLTAADRQELLSFLEWWRAERARRAKPKKK